MKILKNHSQFYTEVSFSNKWSGIIVSLVLPSVAFKNNLHVMNRLENTRYHLVTPVAWTRIQVHWNQQPGLGKGHEMMYCLLHLVETVPKQKGWHGLFYSLLVIVLEQRREAASNIRSSGWQNSLLQQHKGHHGVNQWERKAVTVAGLEISLVGRVQQRPH